MYGQYGATLKDLVEKLKSREGQTIFVDGGAEIVNEMLKENLIDEFIISVIPILLGNGTSLFKNQRPVENLKLLETKTFDTGLVQLHYKVITFEKA
jgi:dihydrofolate reductase